MQLSELKKLNLPKEPGVYIFKKGSDILYVGKATSLFERTKSYFAKDLMTTRGPKIAGMIEDSDTLEWQTTDSVLEALILEAKLIKIHQPPANTRDKDDKSYWYVVITKEDFPRVLMVRGKELFGLTGNDEFLPEHLDETYGPFPAASELKEAMKIIRKLFPYRDTCEIQKNPINLQAPTSLLRPPRSKSGECFNARIGLCPGVCGGKMTKEEYRKRIRHIKMFFEGKKREIMEDLNREMLRLSDEEKFEEAAQIRNKLFGLEHIQDISLLKRENMNARTGYRVEAYDAAHISGTSLVGVMTVVTGGELDKNQYRKFKIRVGKQNDDNKTLREVLSRRLKHPEWRYPDLIVVDGSVAQKNTAKTILKELGQEIPVAAVVKNDQHRPSHILAESEIIKDHKTDILLANAEAHRFAIAYHKKLREKALLGKRKR